MPDPDVDIGTPISTYLSSHDLMGKSTYATSDRDYEAYFFRDEDAGVYWVLLAKNDGSGQYLVDRVIECDDQEDWIDRYGRMRR